MQTAAIFFYRTFIQTMVLAMGMSWLISLVRDYSPCTENFYIYILGYPILS